MKDDLVSSQRLATYGSLSPGKSNHAQLHGLDGHWFTGHVHGQLFAAGWGADLGYPALVLDPDGDAVEVQIFESADLPAHWSRLDDFEGSQYRRVLTAVDTPSGPIEACIYVLNSAESAPTDQRPLGS
ncbi:gamma-glutamylcyclotransferase family protein [Catellatospora tritici]|uniref:gamma-glutamylcyclotransferase family protein n=1 Tax=Catellatospora tritici TaxID=2851566 RepID=UPI001C2D9E0F|nr:gamma-glutamylcyclotransferase [Catellatospora tritici]MBV1850566.1 gamma-glutamylcyclotransferase [Catellatospora tritici]